MQSLRPRTTVVTSLGVRFNKARLTIFSFFDRPLPFRCPNHIPVRHATHGAQGRANGPKNSPGRRLGAKKASNEYVVTGNIIFRQRGSKWFPGENVGMGRDHTIYALQCGYVKYYRNPAINPDRKYIGITFERDHQLPRPLTAPRWRRLGMDLVPRNEKEMIREAALNPPAPLSKVERQYRRKITSTGRIPKMDLKLGSDYSYREANWQIGRAAERAGSKITKMTPLEQSRMRMYIYGGKKRETTSSKRRTGSKGKKDDRKKSRIAKAAPKKIKA